MINRKKILIAAGLLALLCTGCNSTPFAPIAVPRNTVIVRPETPRNQARKYAELERLQRVMPAAYTITSNDVLAIAVEGQAELSRPSVLVMPDGTISVAPIGSLSVVGRTLQDVAAELQKKYQKYVKDCNVVVEPVSLKPYKFTIGGTVTAPGVYPFAFGNFRLTDAVAMAQGLLTVGDNGGKQVLADLENAYISRQGKILPVDFKLALEQGSTLNNIPILDGDYIYIPSLENGKITVLGEVGGQNCLPFQPDLTLLQAIALSGGLKETNSKDIKVIRGGLKNPVVYNINIKDIQQGRSMDFLLQPRDIVFVPRDPISEWNVIIRLITPSIQFLNGVAGPFGNPAMLYND